MTLRKELSLLTFIFTVWFQGEVLFFFKKKTYPLITNDGFKTKK